MRHQFLLPVRVLVSPGRAERGQPDQELRLGTVADDVVADGAQHAFLAGHRGLLGLPVLDHRSVFQRVDQSLFLFGHFVHEVVGVLGRLRCLAVAVPERPGWRVVVGHHRDGRRRGVLGGGGHEVLGVTLHRRLAVPLHGGGGGGAVRFRLLRARRFLLELL